ncbi:NUDIX hydrolase [Candidatus Woesearchaeota archaeon]|nr:NUDIX hydrolase [Candidatus Woesearchaeota archaeon]
MKMTAIQLEPPVKEEKKSLVELVCGIIPQEGRILTLWNKSKARYELPGGKKIDDEDYKFCIMRELDEELKLSYKEKEIDEINGYIELVNQIPINKCINSKYHEEIIPLLFLLRLKDGFKVSPRLGSGYSEVRWMDIMSEEFKRYNLSELTRYVCDGLFEGKLELPRKKI